MTKMALTARVYYSALHRAKGLALRGKDGRKKAATEYASWEQEGLRSVTNKNNQFWTNGKLTIRTTK